MQLVSCFKKFDEIIFGISLKRAVNKDNLKPAVPCDPRLDMIEENFDLLATPFAVMHDICRFTGDVVQGNVQIEYEQQVRSPFVIVRQAMSWFTQPSANNTFEYHTQ